MYTVVVDLTFIFTYIIYIVDRFMDPSVIYIVDRFMDPSVCVCVCTHI